MSLMTTQLNCRKLSPTPDYTGDDLHAASMVPHESASQKPNSHFNSSAELQLQNFISLPVGILAELQLRRTQLIRDPAFVLGDLEKVVEMSKDHRVFLKMHDTNVGQFSAKYHPDDQYFQGSLLLYRILPKWLQGGLLNGFSESQRAVVEEQLSKYELSDVRLNEEAFSKVRELVAFCAARIGSVFEFKHLLVDPPKALDILFFVEEKRASLNPPGLFSRTASPEEACGADILLRTLPSWLHTAVLRGGQGTLTKASYRYISERFKTINAGASESLLALKSHLEALERRFKNMEEDLHSEIKFIRLMSQLPTFGFLAMGTYCAWMMRDTSMPAALLFTPALFSYFIWRWVGNEEVQKAREKAEIKGLDTTSVSSWGRGG